MIDLNKLRENPTEIKNAILKKEPTFNVDKLIDFDQKERIVRLETEKLQQEKNSIAAQAQGGVTPALRERSIALGKELKEKSAQLESLESEKRDLWLSCPNIPENDIPVGHKDKNLVVKTVGTKPTFNFSVKNHLELNEHVKWFDMQAATNMSGAQFVFYNEMGTKVIYALTRMMLKNNKKHGFSPVMPPALVNEKSLYTSGNLPKFEGAFYRIPEDNLCLIPTSEVALTNVHSNQILSTDDLPKRYTSWTSCYRREAGGYGSLERGLIRIHQFEKVELFSITKAEESSKELDLILQCSQELLQQLGLHYQVSLLATQDCSFQSAKTYDIEVWLPGQNTFYEVSSCSNCTDFQARRAGIRFRRGTEAKPELVHTLNGSSLALPRLMVALMETGQQKDGSIILPEVLQKEMDNLW